MNRQKSLTLGMIIFVILIITAFGFIIIGDKGSPFMLNVAKNKFKTYVKNNYKEDEKFFKYSKVKYSKKDKSYYIKITNIHDKDKYFTIYLKNRKYTDTYKETYK